MEKREQWGSGGGEGGKESSARAAAGEQRCARWRRLFREQISSLTQTAGQGRQRRQDRKDAMHINHSAAVCRSGQTGGRPGQQIMMAGQGLPGSTDSPRARRVDHTHAHTHGLVRVIIPR